MSNAPLLTSFHEGHGTPVLVVHGWQMSGRAEATDLEPVFRDAIGYRRIYVELPGMGATPADGVRSLDEMYERLSRFVRETIGPARFLVAGTSAGAYLARALAHRFRAQVDGLLLRVPLVNPDNKDRDVDPPRPLVADPALMAGLDQSDRDLLGNVLVQTPEYVAALRARNLHDIRPAVDGSDAKALDPIRGDPQLYRLAPENEPSPAEKLPFPVLILCGRQDEVVGFRDSLRFLEQYPRSTFVVLDRETHGLPLQTRDVFNALVGDWLRRTSEWRVTRSLSG